MVHRAEKRPCVSVVLAAHNAGAHIGRAVESVLNQTFPYLELIIADCGSTDRTRSLCERFVERDIRVEALYLEDESCQAGRNLALSRARGTYVLFVNQSDWINPGFLQSAVEVANQKQASLVIPELSVDTEQADGARVSSTLVQEACFWESAAEFRLGSSTLVENGVLAFAAGKLLRRDLIDEGGCQEGCDEDEQAFMVRYVRDADRVAVVEGARYHLCTGKAQARPVYDSKMFGRCERDYERVKNLYLDWGLGDDAEMMAVVYRRHLHDAIRCIENACVGTGHLSTNERRDAVEHVINAESTRDSVHALKSMSHEFGIMYAPIARRSVTACCMGARIQEIVGRALMPFTPAAASARM